MSNAATCLRCGAPLETPAASCTRCLLAVALDTPTIKLKSNFLDDLPMPAETLVIADKYTVIETIARGGMGVVYKARQENLNRVVAVKMLLGGVHAGEDFKRRFLQEAKAAARLNHPNIVSIHDWGEDAGQPFFSMDFIEGHTLAEMAREQPLPPRAAAEIVRTLAQAMHYAHNEGVLHRDLKPSNVLVDAAGVPRITDFGLARELNAETRLTTTGDFLGTPGFLPPEQISSKRGTVDEQSDVYGLGAILYYLLTSRPPHLAGSPAEALRAVEESDPVPPRRLNPSIPADMETICLKCLEKEPVRRYGSAQALAEDLKRWLSGDPISARPVTSLEKSLKWIGRHPAIASLTGAVVVSVLAGLIGVTWYWRRAETNAQNEASQRRTAVRLQSSLVESLERVQIERAEQFLAAGDFSSGLAILSAVLRANPTNHLALARFMSSVAYSDHAVPLAQYTCGGYLARRLEFSRDGRQLLIVAGDQVHLLDARSLEPLREPLKHGAVVAYATFSPDGNMLATACEDRTAQIWPANGSRPAALTLAHSRQMERCDFSPDGQRLLTQSRDDTSRDSWDALLWEVSSSRLLETHTNIGYARFRPDGQGLVYRDVGQVGKRGAVSFTWDAHTAEIIKESRYMRYAEFGHSGRMLMRLTWGGYPELYDALTGELVSGGHKGDDIRVNFARLSPDDEQFLIASPDMAVRIFDSRSGILRVGPLRQDAELDNAEFSPNGDWVMTLGGGEVRLWSAHSGSALMPPIRHPGGAMKAAISPDGSRLVTSSSWTDEVILWDIRPSKPMTHPLKSRRWAHVAKFTADSTRIASSVGWEPDVLVWDLRNPKAPSMMFTSDGSGFTDFDVSPDGERMVQCSDTGSVRIWDIQKRSPLIDLPRHSPPVLRVKFTQDGSRITTCDFTNQLRIWDARTGQPLSRPLPSNWWSPGGAISPNGNRLLNFSNAAVSITDTLTGQPVGTPWGNDFGGNGASFSDDGKRVVTWSDNRTARIWRVETGDMLTPPLLHEGEVRHAEFSPDGQLIVTASVDGTAQVWNAATGQPLNAPLKHRAIVHRAEFSRDSRRVATASRDRTARIWDARSGMLLCEFNCRLDVTGAAFSPDGQWLKVNVDGPTARGQSGLPQHGDQYSDQLYNELQVWPLPPALGTAPAWLPDIGEAIAGRRFNDAGQFERVSATNSFALRQMISALPVTNEIIRWTKWFLSDRGARTISPMSVITVYEYLDLLIAENTQTSLRQALVMQSDNALALARLARLSLEPRIGEEPVTERAAVFLSRRAVELAPHESETWLVNAECYFKIGDNAKAIEIIERGLKLHPNNAQLLGAAEKYRRPEASPKRAVPVPQ